MVTTQQDVAHGSRLNAYTALILATLAMIVCFMSWSNFAPLSRPGWDHVPPECGFQNLAVGNAGSVRVDRPDSGGDLIG